MPVSGNEEPGVLARQSSRSSSGIPIKKRWYSFQPLSPIHAGPSSFSNKNESATKYSSLDQGSDLNSSDSTGRRYRFGQIDNQPVILVMTGLIMLNAGITTQLLLALFNVKGVVHYGIAGNANPSLYIGDVAIPQYWAHTALWNWQPE